MRGKKAIRRKRKQLVGQNTSTKPEKKSLKREQKADANTKITKKEI